MTRPFLSRTGLASFVGAHFLAGCQPEDVASSRPQGESRWEADGDTGADSGAGGITGADTAIPSYDGDCGSFLPAATEPRTWTFEETSGSGRTTRRSIGGAP